jgi:AraC family transcriptional regulator
MLQVARTITRRSHESRVLRVLTYMQRHLDCDMTLEELARLAHFSPFHFHRVFRGVVGESIGEHLRRLRLERAALRLRTTSDSVIYIALDAGYDAHEAFTRAFRAAYQMSPTQFRSCSDVSIELSAPSQVHYEPNAVAITFVPLKGASMIDVRVETIQPLRVAYIRGNGPYAQMFPPLWKRFNEIVNLRGLRKPEAWYLSICLDDPQATEPDKIRGDACVSVDDSFSLQANDELKLQTIPAGMYAIARYVGPYSGLGAAWGELCGQWIPANQYQFRQAPCFEVYRSDPKTTPQEQLLTEIYEPVQRK